MTGIRRAEIPFAEVEQAVQAHVKADPGGVFRVDPALIGLIGGQVGFDQRAVQYSWESGQAWDRFAAQVKRALDKMASINGGQVLRKAGAGSAGPDGREVYRNEVRWYTPAAWEDAARQAARQAEADRMAGVIADGIIARLAALGVDAYRRGHEVRIADPDSWDGLLALAERPEAGGRVTS